jgi:hypothetical protein
MHDTRQSSATVHRSDSNPIQHLSDGASDSLAFASHLMNGCCRKLRSGGFGASLFVALPGKSAAGTSNPVPDTPWMSDTISGSRIQINMVVASQPCIGYRDSSDILRECSDLARRV